ncbi:MAG: HIT domain-containing protein [Deltaproteobacteria bacterium]|nr:HIT domain-containing protein [Deltaproteobacteria bacterium]MBW2307844.1 HIT domain-containing protein [Deltaproteobacteria bacterium]
MSDRLWAPWRIQYIKNPKPSGCIFCQAVSEEGNERKNLILMRNAHVFIIMNRYPYNSGHLMVAPLRHLNDLTTLTKDEMSAVMDAIRSSTETLKKAMGAKGFNVGINIGKVAGAGLYEHLHVHVVPRWSGDVNFMPVMADVHVLPELLAQTYDHLKPFFNTREQSSIYRKSRVE